MQELLHGSRNSSSIFPIFPPLSICKSDVQVRNWRQLNMLMECQKVTNPINIHNTTRKSLVYIIGILLNQSATDFDYNHPNPHNHAAQYLDSQIFELDGVFHFFSGLPWQIKKLLILSAQRRNFKFQIKWEISAENWWSKIAKSLICYV
jgi:hypothetical protein